MKIKKVNDEEMQLILENIASKVVLCCSKCGGNIRFRKNNSDRGICEWSACRNNWGRWDKTVFKCLRIPQLKVLQILQFWVNKLNVTQIAFFADVDRGTVDRLLRKVARIFEPAYAKSFSMIGGNSMVVEIDESLFGKRKYNKGYKNVSHMWVLGAVERSPERRIFLQVLEDRKATSLNTIIEKHVSPESIIHTDCWRGYKSLISHFQDHKTVNHTHTYVNRDNGCHTNTIEGNWTAIKFQIPYRYRRKNRINLYLARYMLLRNEKGNPFLNLLKFLF